MRFTLAIFCIFACGTSAVAQYGVSNARDIYGNLIRNTGMKSAKGLNQGPSTTSLSRTCLPRSINSGLRKGTSR
jgi:hypothetical protein